MTPPVLIQIITSMASIMGVVPDMQTPKKHSQQLVKAPVHPGPIPVSYLPQWLPWLQETVEAQLRGSEVLKSPSTELKFYTGTYDSLTFLAYD